MMWKLFTHSGNMYMLRAEKNEDILSVLLTDLTFAWEGQFSTKDLVNIFKEANPLISATDELITNNFWEVIEGLPDNTNVDVILDSGAMVAVLEKKCESVNQKIVYKLILTKASQDKFKHGITIPTIQTIYFLEKQQKMLLSLIQKKDRELEEFRLERGDISRGDLRTDKFEPNALKSNKNSVFLNLFSDVDNNSFWQKFTEQNGEVKPADLHVELEPWNSRPKRKIIRSGKNVLKKGSGVSFKK